MSESDAQSFKNHGRVDPAFHLVLATVLVVNLVMAIVYSVKHFDMFTAWLVILSVAIWIPVLEDPALCAQGAGPRDSPGRAAAAAGAGPGRVACGDLPAHRRPIGRAAVCVGWRSGGVGEASARQEPRPQGD